MNKEQMAGLTTSVEKLTKLAGDARFAEVGDRDYDTAARLWGEASSLARIMAMGLAKVADECLESRLRCRAKAAKG